MIVEILAAALPLFTATSVIFDHACKLHIDNLADLQTLVKGCSQALDLVHLSIVDVGENSVLVRVRRISLKPSRWWVSIRSS